MASESPRRVLIVERRLTAYRIPLHERMRNLLADKQIELQLLVGEGTSEETARSDGGHLSWATVLPTHYFGAVCWQPFGRHLRAADLVVVNHQNRLLYNHWLLCAARPCRVGLWGHGRNMQATAAGGWREHFRRWTISRADWYFAYTQIAVDVVAESGFPVTRITNLNNTIDTSQLRRERDSLSPDEVAALKEDLGISGRPVGVFIGSLHAGKRLDFLFEACQRVRQRLPAFQCLIVGDGVERPKVQGWVAAHDWIHWVGARQGRDKALYLACADVMLNPGMVGLGIIDSFVFGIPIITTDCRIHSPEIAYLKPGENGVITRDDVGAFAVAVASLLGDPVALTRMRQASLASAGDHLIEHMADRFADGIGSALAAPRRR